MNDSAAGLWANPVAVLAGLLHVLAESADGRQGRQLWDSLVGIVDIQSGSHTSDEAVGAAELAALRQEPGDADRAEALARALLARAADDERFRSALNDWRGQRLIQALERSASVHPQAGAVGPLSASRKQESSDSNITRQHAIMNRIGDFMVWLGGGNKSILVQVPQERPRFAQMAGVMLTTAGMASLSMIFALRDGVNAPLTAAILFGLVWGVVVLNLDRFLVLSIGSTRDHRRLLLIAVPRLVLALVLSIVISTPLVLRIFASDISSQLHKMHSGTGILAQLQALSDLSKQSSGIEVARLTLYVLLTLIAILPVIIKLLLNLGPMSAYEIVVRSKEEEVIATARQERRDLAASLNNLGVRYASLGRVEQALGATKGAVALYRDPTTSNPALAANLAGSLSNLGALYSDLGRTADALSATREAVALYRDLASSNPALAIDLAGSLSNLGALYSDLGRIADALSATREAVALYRDLDQVDCADLGELTATSANLAAALQSRYRSTGATDDLEQAIDLLQQALAATPGDHLDRPVLLSNLAAALQSRYRSTGATDDLEQAVELQRQALAATPGDHPNHPLMLSKLAALVPQRGADHG